MLHVIGHKNPDTDAILSALLYAKFIQLKGFDAKPCRLGELNNETIFVLKTL
jgi:manganese-dependent inorganic pyrophosphatase